MSIKAFIFDLDGVLTDTAEYHYQAWKELADELGLSFNRTVNERLKGISRLRSFEIILEHNGISSQYTEDEKSEYSNRKNAKYQKLIQQITPANALPGVQIFLEQAKASGLLLAVASASENALTVLKALGIIGQFDFIADSEKIQNPKPDPEIFLACAKALGITPDECVGFEDAQAGIEAIKAAGMHAVGIHADITTVPPDINYDSTSELDVQAVLRMFAPQSISEPE